MYAIFFMYFTDVASYWGDPLATYRMPYDHYALPGDSVRLYCEGFVGKYIRRCPFKIRYFFYIRRTFWANITKPRALLRLTLFFVCFSTRTGLRFLFVLDRDNKKLDKNMLSLKKRLNSIEPRELLKRRSTVNNAFLQIQCILNFFFF